MRGDHLRQGPQDQVFGPLGPLCLPDIYRGRVRPYPEGRANISPPILEKIYFAVLTMPKFIPLLVNIFARNVYREKSVLIAGVARPFCSRCQI